jgi:dCMP deaminase
MQNKILIAFVPVIHKGYFDLFKKYPDYLLILGEDIIKAYIPLVRDLRMIGPKDIKKMLEDGQICKKVEILSLDKIKDLVDKNFEFVMVDDDVSHDLAEKYFKNEKVVFESVFLRWGSRLQTETENVIASDRIISEKDFDRDFIKMAENESEKSSDWWRQIGAVLVKEGEILYKAHNHHLPTDFHLSTFGDPRSNFDKGEKPEIYTSIHSEANIVAMGAKDGVSLKGSSIYVTTFPCSNCARLLCEAGIKKVFYKNGYSRLDAEKIFKSFDVEIVLVK